MKSFFIIFSLLSFTLFSEASAPKGGGPQKLEATIINSTTVKLTWQGEMKDFAYRLRKRAIGDKQWTYYNINAPTSLRRFSNLLPATKYEWQVQTFYSESKRDTSFFISGPNFTTFSNCDQPENLESEVVSSQQAILRWEFMNTNALYKIKLKVYGADSWKVYFTSSNNLIVSNLIPSTLYEWSMVAYCDGDTNFQSPSSENARFVTAENDDDVISISEPKINSYENNSWKSNDDINIVAFYQKENSQQQQANLISTVGQVRAINMYYRTNEGEIAFDINDEIPDGVYTLEYVTNHKLYSQTIIVARR